MLFTQASEQACVRMSVCSHKYGILRSQNQVAKFFSIWENQEDISLESTGIHNFLTELQENKRIYTKKGISINT
jgi:hypothetical protein